MDRRRNISVVLLKQIIMKNKDKKNSAGLTLVEVLLSIVSVLSIGVSTLMLATNRCLTVIKRAQNRDIAQNLIRQINTDHQ